MWKSAICSTVVGGQLLSRLAVLTCNETGSLTVRSAAKSVCLSETKRKMIWLARASGTTSNNLVGGVVRKSHRARALISES